MSGNKKVGYLTETDDEQLSISHDRSSIIWASIWKGSEDNKTLATIFFTRQDSPRFNEWFKSLCEVPKYGHWNIIQKGTYIHGYYYKISITTVLDNAQKLLDSLEKWSYHSDEGINYKIETHKDMDTVYTELLAKAI